ncbi:MAG: hypothetical protein MI810_16230 [Flavobacteriales bacterium]|nr:hypothetical protein [Flavobacteriales bacterium]
MGGTSSPFRINVDGVSGDEFSEVEIPANDSLFVFVEVTLSVNGGTLPLVVSDSIRFKTNGSNQYVNLDVWGQDAYFHANEVVEGVWPNDKPHVLYGIVACGFPGLDSNKNLTIPAGTQVYCHKDAQLIVYKSSIDIEGSFGNEVTFQGDRLESFYDDVSGQWWGIRLIEAEESNINYAIIRNGSVGLQVDSTSDATTLNLSNTIIDNNDFFGLNVNAGANVQAENCIFASAGISSAYLFAGGEYNFKHCDFVNYWSGGRSGPALLIKNWWEYENTLYCRQIVNSTFSNCVMYGNVEEEFRVDTLNCGFVDFEVRNCLLRRDEIYNYDNYIGNIWNQNPGFLSIDPDNLDLHFGASSPLNEAGDASGTFSNFSDLEMQSRDGSPDIGCYELP